MLENIKNDIRDCKLEIEEYQKLKTIFQNNMGKKLTKRQLGKTPATTYGDSIGPRFKTYIEIKTSPYRNCGYIEFHDPIVKEDIETIDRHIGWKVKQIASLEYLLNNRAEVITKREALKIAQKIFEDTLLSFIDTVHHLEIGTQTYREYFNIGNSMLERTYFQREY